jgi:hypothetical protein
MPSHNQHRNTLSQKREQLAAEQEAYEKHRNMKTMATKLIVIIAAVAMILPIAASLFI